MTLLELLRQKRDALVSAWTKDALQAYPDDAAALFARGRDPFGNPVGHSIEVCTGRAVDALLNGVEVGDVCRHLEEVIRIRAVQEMPPSQAVGFVLRLKDVVRTLLDDSESPDLAGDLAVLHGRIDRLALAAFDVYVECRERVSELRINEVKRSVSWVVDRINRRTSGVLSPVDPVTGTGEV